MANDIRSFRKAAVMGGFLSRAGELGFTPEEVEGLLLKTAASVAGVVTSLVPTAGLGAAAVAASPYFAGKALGGMAGSASHTYGRSLDRLDDSSMVSLKRRLIQVLQMNREVEGDLSARDMKPTQRVGAPAGKRRPTKSKNKQGPAELVD